MRRVSKIARIVYGLICENPGITMVGVAAFLNVQHPVYGKQRAASRAIAELRRAGMVEDVACRCDKCDKAQTRGSRNVPLYPTKMSREEKRILQLELL